MTKLLSAIVALTIIFIANGVMADEGDNGIGTSMTQTNYIGARLLSGGENVNVGDISVGPYDDFEDRNRYGYWQGDTHFAGVSNPETGNKVDIVSEWYWFESSIPRNADFYVGTIKVKSSPNVVDSWYLKEENGWYGNIMWPDDVIQLLKVDMYPSGEWGGIRWDWCVPFDTYSYEPMQTIEVASTYSAGFDVEGNVDGTGKAGFSEGGKLTDLSAKANIQAKGYVNGKHSVSTQYTITLFKWQVLVSSGADSISWQMRLLKDGNHQDSAYHEYFVVVQAEKGSEVWIPAMHIAANFKHSIWWWFDGYEALSATIQDITFTPPPTCYVDDPIPVNFCKTNGVCENGAVFCGPLDGEWLCNYPDEYEVDEITCDSLDNDCDGKTDEAFILLGMDCDSEDDDLKKGGKWVCSPEGMSLVCDEDPCAAKQCGDGCGNCDLGFQCYNNKCIDEVEDSPPEGELFNCNGITETGQCDGNWLFYCAGGKLVEQYCAFCCKFNVNANYYDCMTYDKCEPEECVSQCQDKQCGPNGCGGICGICDVNNTCNDDGVCEWQEHAQEDKHLVCGQCPAGYICSATGECIVQYEQQEQDTIQGCSAGSGTSNGTGLFLFIVIMMLSIFRNRTFLREGR
jgi:hypothetical protein